MPTTPSPDFSDELISEPVARLIALFSEHEDQLQFPGVSARTLAELSHSVERQAGEVDRLAEQLADAREQLFVLRRSLLQHARQAHAYATIFAGTPSLSGEPPDAEALGPDPHEDLRRGLASIDLQESQKTGRAAGRKKRPEKSTDTRTEPSLTDPSLTAAVTAPHTATEDATDEPSSPRRKQRGRAPATGASVAAAE